MYGHMSSSADDERAALLRPSTRSYTPIPSQFETLVAPPPPVAPLGLRQRKRGSQSKRAALHERRRMVSSNTDKIFQLEESPNRELLEYLKPILISLDIEEADLDAFMMTRKHREKDLEKVLTSTAVVPDDSNTLVVQNPSEIDYHLEGLVKRLAKMTPKKKDAGLKKERTFENPNSILKPMFLCYHALLLNLSKASNSDLKSIGNLFKTIFDKRIFEMVGVTFEDVALYTATVSSFRLDLDDTYELGKDDFNPKKDFHAHKISQSLSGIFLYATSHFYSCVIKSVPHMVNFDALKNFADKVTKIAKAILWKIGAGRLWEIELANRKPQEELFTLDQLVRIGSPMGVIYTRNDNENDPIYNLTDDFEKLNDVVERRNKLEKARASKGDPPQRRRRRRRRRRSWMLLSRARMIS